VQRLRQVKVLALLGIERAEEAQLVLDDRTTDVTTEVGFREAIRG